MDKETKDRREDKAAMKALSDENMKLSNDYFELRAALCHALGSKEAREEDLHVMGNLIENLKNGGGKQTVVMDGCELKEIFRRLHKIYDVLVRIDVTEIEEQKREGKSADDVDECLRC